MEAQGQKAESDARAFFFRRVATRGGRFFTIGVIGWVALGIFAYFQPFVPSDAMKTVSVFISIFFVFFFATIFARNGYLLETLSKIVRDHFIAGVAAAIIFSIANFLSSAWGLGLIGTLTFGEEHFAEYEVTWKSDGSAKRRDCRYSINIGGTAGKKFQHMCINRGMWEYAKIGSNVKMMERVSWFGLHLEKYERIHSEE